MLKLGRYPPQKIQSSHLKQLERSLKKKIRASTGFETGGYKYCVNKSRDMSRDHLAKNGKTGGGFSKRNRTMTFFSFILNISNTLRLE